MESALNCEYKKLVDELTQGMEKAMQLRFHLSSMSAASEAHDLLLRTIISTFQNALLILKWGGSIGRPQAPESSIDAEDASPKSNKFRDRRDNVDTTKKRNMQTTTWTEQVRIRCENGVEGARDDIYSWRKYGQKHILEAKHPRSYYRCTYRHVRNCWATKQVQRSDDDQTLFDITYKGNHMCNRSSNAQEQEMERKQHNQTLLDTEDMNIPSHFLFPSTFSCNERENEYSPISASALGDEYAIMGTNSPVFYTLAATSESNYFSAATNRQMTTERHASSSSTTNSPNGGMEITFDLDPDFPFNIPGFFT